MHTHRNNVNGNEIENHTAETMCKYVQMNDYSEKSNRCYFYASVGFYINVNITPKHKSKKKRNKNKK